MCLLAGFREVREDNWHAESKSGFIRCELTLLINRVMAMFCPNSLQILIVFV